MWTRCLILALCVGLPTAAAAESRYVYTNHRFDYVRIQAIAKKELAAKSPTHPAVIPVAKMGEMLAAVRLSRRSVFRKEVAAQEVFPERAVSALAPKLVAAFQQAGADEEVVFSWLWKDPEFIVRNDRFTVAKAWVHGNELHLQFLKLHAQLTGDYDKKGNFDKAVNRSRGIRIDLEPQPGQMLGSSNAEELVIDMTQTYAATK